jgi:hypothetical protein
MFTLKDPVPASYSFSSTKRPGNFLRETKIKDFFGGAG